MKIEYNGLQEHVHFFVAERWVIQHRSNASMRNYTHHIVQTTKHRTGSNMGTVVSVSHDLSDSSSCSSSPAAMRCNSAVKSSKLFPVNSICCAAVFAYMNDRKASKMETNCSNPRQITVNHCASRPAPKQSVRHSIIMNTYTTSKTSQSKLTGR